MHFVVLVSVLQSIFIRGRVRVRVPAVAVLTWCKVRVTVRTIFERRSRDRARVDGARVTVRVWVAFAYSSGLGFV